VSGIASITQSGNTTDIRQSSTDLSIDWLSFNVGSQATVDFIQPSASSVAVNRIAGTNGSEILGHLDANGQVYLINPNGIVFGQGAQINVDGLVASTLDVSNESLSGTTRSFSGDGTGTVVNQGSITANGGYVALLGNRVSNQGVITAQLGTVALGAGSAVTLDFSGNRLIHLQVDQSTLNNLAANLQLIQADGGLVIMTAGAQRTLLASVVNNSGIIEARTVESHAGTIELLGGMTAGTVNVAGTLDASAPTGGNGGFIETNAAHVEVANGAKVTTAASKGLYGTWLIDPTDFTVAPTGGDITGATLSSDLNSTNFTILSSSGASPVTGGGSGGNINVDDTVSWSANTTLTLTAANNVNVNSPITASGATAGLVIKPNTKNGSESASGSGTFNLGATEAITLSGAGASLSISTSKYVLNLGSTINLPNVSPTSTTALIIGGKPYTVINSLGSQGSITGTDLQGMQGNLSGLYALGSNIDASATSSWAYYGDPNPNNDYGIAMIGTVSAPFKGTLDGLGHVIGNLLGAVDLAAPKTPYSGLFGATATASVIRNLGVTGVIMFGYGVGGLVGQNTGTISNCYVTGNVTGFGRATSSTMVGMGGLVGLNSGTITNSYFAGSLFANDMDGTHNGVGGLVGFNISGGTINNSYSTGNISGGTPDVVGGLAGYNYGQINNSYATGSVTANTPNGVGGLVGTNFGAISNSYATGSARGYRYIGGLVGTNIGTISNSYATGSVTGATDVGQLGTDVGGLVGYGVGGTISNSYAVGKVSGSNYVGGLMGGEYEGSVINSFWNITTSGQTTSAAGTGLTTAQMQTAGNFTGFNFTTIPGASGNAWVMVDADGTLNNVGGATGAVLPMLASEYSTTIMNAHQLQLMAMNLAANYSVGQTVTAANTSNGTDVWSSLLGFVPIGNAATPFTGSFNGLGKTIGNLAINPGVAASNQTATGVGLFGVTGTASVIRNVGLAGGSVGGATYVGALVGENQGSVSNSYATSPVSAPQDLGGPKDIGGLVGYNTGTISNSYATGSVSGNTVGGLVGASTGAISNSYATGSVTGSTYIGGLVGYAMSGTISNSYAKGNVSGVQDLGGLVGYNMGTITNSYATGNINGLNSQAAIPNSGGLVGVNTGTISNSYATGNLTGPQNFGGSYGVGGLVGSNFGGTITDSYATGIVSGYGSVGGLVGQSMGTISNSYATGRVTGVSYVGGLVGYEMSGTVSNSYAVGNVSGSSYVGGLSGKTNTATINNSFWDLTTTGQPSSAGGTGMTTAQMQTQANFTSATGANGNANPGWDFAGTWVMYNGYTYPLLRSFMTPLNVTANNASTTYSSSAYSGGNGVTYSTTPNANLQGTVTYGGSSQGAVNAGSYAITPGGLYSNQKGYIISYASGALTINPAALTLDGSRVYDGTTIVAGSILTATGVAGQTFSVTGAGDPSNLASKDVQTESLTSATGLAIGSSGNGGLASNYYLSTTGSSITLTPLALTGAAIGSASSTYGSAVTPGAVSFGNVVAGDAVSASASIASPLYSGSGNLAAGYYAQTASSALSGANAGDYSFSGYTTPTNNYTVNPLALAVTGVTATNRVYNGSTADPLSGTPAIAPISNDVVSLSGSGSGAFADPNVGNGKAVTVSGFSLIGTDAGNYTLVEPSGLSANITQLASVAWVGGATGNWSTASNWAGGALPDLSNVAAVTIPKNTTVTYDAGVVGITLLSSLTDSGKLVMAAGDLSTTGNLSTAGYTQSGGTLDVGGTLSIAAKTGAVTLGNIDAAALSITALKGTITQLLGSAVDVTGATSLTADNGTGGLNTITLTQAGDSFGGTVTAEGSAITLKDKTALTAIVDSSGATTLTAVGNLNVSGTVATTLTTKTTGAKHTTTFGATTVGTSLVVISTGKVTETSSNILTVAGEGTTTVSNPNVTVNGVVGAEIAAP